MYKPHHVNFTTRRSAWFGHIPFAFSLVAREKPDILVELGTHWGGSYFSFCDSVKANSTDTLCFAVDTWQGEAHAGIYDEQVFNYVTEKNREFSKFSTLLRKRFDDAASSFDAKSVDILHIDGFHSYEAVRNDYETWLPKMKDNGIILFHDVMVTKPGFGVKKFWSEISESFPDNNLVFRHSNGLGVLSLDTTQSIKERFSIRSRRLYSAEMNIRAKLLEVNMRLRHNFD
ncbi:class I SAM-dependent methyltransferase [Sulfitobacter sp. 1A15299]|uniref:class I SAM-dependent methyltransferase n=1 Tax=Sulfitobacter sp. 1A15299 TaxID=3368598 RepID=UPI003746DC7B